MNRVKIHYKNKFLHYVNLLVNFISTFGPKDVCRIDYTPLLSYLSELGVVYLVTDDKFFTVWYYPETDGNTLYIRYDQYIPSEKLASLAVITVQEFVNQSCAWYNLLSHDMLVHFLQMELSKTIPNLQQILFDLDCKLRTGPNEIQGLSDLLEILLSLIMESELGLPWGRLSGVEIGNA